MELMELEYLKSKVFKVIILESRMVDKAAYGMAIEGDGAYAVFPNGL